MDPATMITILGWFANPAAQAIFAIAQTYVQQRLGLSDSSSSSHQVEPLLDKYLQQLMARLDEDRIAKLYGAFSKLTDASKSVAKYNLLGSALDDFHEVARIPEHGMTGKQPNAELRCMAFVGMVVSYTLLQDRVELIEEKMIEAVFADATTAKQWLGEDIVREILAQLPAPTVPCPQCGFQNPVGSKFCNQDAYPLKAALLHFIRQPNSNSSLFVNAAILVPLTMSKLTSSLEIILDDKKIGVIRQGENSILEIQPGHYGISLRSLGRILSPRLSFDIAPGEKVTFLCQVIIPPLGLMKIQFSKQ